jgi:hypothetical protein
VLLGVLAVKAYCSSPWDKFLMHPGKDALVTLEGAIAASAQNCSWGNPSNRVVAPKKKQVKQLFALIVKGNESAFDAALMVSKCLDGGDLEDFYRSTGIFFEIQPRFFLQIVKNRAIPYSEIRYLLTMLPLDTVDNIDRKISVVEKRIKILKNISNESFKEIKEKGLSFLENEKENLVRIKSEMK